MTEDNSQLQYRRLTHADLDAVHALELQCFTAPWSREAFVSEFNAPHRAIYYGALFNNTLLAYGGYWLVLDEAHITNIAVHRQARRQGIGLGLMRILEADAAQRQVALLTLEVRRSNLAAQSLYGGLGYKQVGIRKRYYPDNAEDALIFTKEL